MDTTALAFYAAICGLPPLDTPSFGKPGICLVVGAAIGIAATAALSIPRASVAA